MNYAVWYASAGCLPDNMEPEFIGNEDECHVYVIEQINEQLSDPEYDGTHDLYSWTIEEYDEEEGES